MKITEFALSVCLDEYVEDYVHIKFTYGDGNYGDYSMPHYDEIQDILEYRFEPNSCEGKYEKVTLEDIIMDNQGDWFSLEY